jgi:hypothetical protein
MDLADRAEMIRSRERLRKLRSIASGFSLQRAAESFGYEQRRLKADSMASVA